MDYYNGPNSHGQHKNSKDSSSVSNSSASPQNSNTSPSSPIGVAKAPLNSATNGTAASASAPRIRRRNRMITSCLECRRRKLKCNKSHPCTNCVKFSRDCVFLAPALDPASQLKLTEIKEKVGSLERLLERDVAKTATNATSSNPGPDRALPNDADDDLPANEDEKDLEPTPLAVTDAAYGDDGEDDGLLDLGIQLGKMRITGRIGGFFRPKIAEELLYTMDDTFATGCRIPGATNPLSAPAFKKELPPAEEWLRPGPSYIIPSSGFFFGTQEHQASLAVFLPSRIAADRLIKQYFACVHPIVLVVHRPTFEKEYDAFWDRVSLGIEPPNSVQVIVFAAIFSAVVSLDESVIIRDFGVSKQSLTSNFKLGTEAALARANFLITTKIETLQGFVMYLIPLCRAEVSRAHSVLLGAAIRMAECMGLHRDGETYGMNTIEIHVRRLVWHHLCCLDIRTCEAQGPRPTIRRDEFDTKLPLNVDGVDLHATGKPPVPANRWTDATYSLIRFEANEMMRTIWVDRPRIESRKISLTAVLSKIETFRTNMAAKYDHLLDDQVPVQKAAKITKSLLISRMHIMVLHLYHTSTVTSMPERLKGIMMAAGTMSVETAVALETLPELQPWVWFTGALQQYHTAFLLLVEIYLHPERKEADRIWPCLDYIFECDPADTRQIKALKVLSEVQQKSAVYQSMRGMRAPVKIAKHVSQRPPRTVRLGENSQPSEEGVKEPKYPRREESAPSPPQPGSVPLHAENMELPGVVCTSIARGAPIPEVVFAGVSNGESLWALPKQSSPEASSESNSTGKAPLSSNSGNDDLMSDIDWDAFDVLFPPEQVHELEVPFFQFPSSRSGAPLSNQYSAGGPVPPYDSGGGTGQPLFSGGLTTYPDFKAYRR